MASSRYELLEDSQRGCTWVAAGIGVLLVLGVYGPYLGRSFSVLGVHVRIVSYGLGCLGALLALIFARRARIDIPFLVGALMLALLVGVYSSSAQWANVSQLVFETDYATHKLGMFVQIGLPAILMGVAGNVWRDNRTFQKGVCLAMVVLGADACVYGLLHRDLFFGRTYETVKELIATKTVSPISLSMLVTSAFCVVVLAPVRSNIAWGHRAAFLALFFLFIVTLNQRAHVIVALVVLALVMRRHGLIIALAMGLTLSAVLLVFWDAVIGDAVVRYWTDFVEGSAFEKRLELLLPCWTGGLAKPLGHGFAAYADLEMITPWPHNAVAEALYELGFPGALVTAALFILVLRKIFPLVRDLPSSSGWDGPIRAVLLLHFVHCVKAGDLTTSVPIMIFLYLVCASPASVRKPKLGRLAPVSRFRSETVVSLPRSPGATLSIVADPGTE
jgi:hypothetical protein